MWGPPFARPCFTCYALTGSVWISRLLIPHQSDIEEDVAFLFVGTNRGELAVVRLGGYV